MRKSKFVRLVVIILFIVLCVVSGAFQPMNLLDWLLDRMQDIKDFINPQPRDILVLIAGAVLGIILKAIYDRIRILASKND